jgi:hypothetical protein
MHWLSSVLLMLHDEGGDHSPIIQPVTLMCRMKGDGQLQWLRAHAGYDGDTLRVKKMSMPVLGYWRCSRMDRCVGCRRIQ